MASTTNTHADSHVWFITGSSHGLGRELTEAVLAANERVVATLRNPSTLSDMQHKYPPSQLLVQPLDATKRHFGRLDVVVNNAGYGLFGEIEATTDEDARKIMEVLFWGPVNITKQAIKFFREIKSPGHGGRILNISSVGGYQANPNLAFYSAGKFAPEGFTQSFIKKMPPAWNIQGCIIEPGGFRTEWGGTSIVTLPQHPAYTDPSFPSSQFRAMHGKIEMIGDPARAAQVIMSIAGERELPLRLQLGTDSWHLVQGQARKTLSEQEKWEKLSHSTNADDCDKDILAHIVSAII